MSSNFHNQAQRGLRLILSGAASCRAGECGIFSAVLRELATRKTGDSLASVFIRLPQASQRRIRTALQSATLGACDITRQGITVSLPQRGKAWRDFSAKLTRLAENPLALLYPEKGTVKREPVSFAEKLAKLVKAAEKAASGGDTLAAAYLTWYNQSK